MISISQSARDLVDPILAHLARAVTIVTVVVVPVLVLPIGHYAFRVPKDALFVAAASLLALITLARQTMQPLAIAEVRRVLLLGGGVVAWSTICLVSSSNRAVAVDSLVALTAAVLFGAAVVIHGREWKMSSLYWLLIPAVVNSIVVLLQRFAILQPFSFVDGTAEHFKYTGLVGNPNDLGSFLVAPLLVAAVLAASPDRLRFIAAGAFLVIGAAVATGSITSLAASGVGLFVIFWLRSRRSALVAAVVLVFVVVAVAVTYEPLRRRVTNIRAAVTGGDLAGATSGRVTPFLAAARMVADHPLTGVGPGGFAWEYYGYKISVERERPHLVRAFAHRFNFGEVHNDHLQTLAETGVPGYLGLLGALALLARCSRKIAGNSDDRRAEIAANLAAPLAASLFVLALAHFPLRLTAPTMAFVFTSGLCVAWFRPVPSSARGSAAPRRPLVAWMVVALVAGVVGWATHRYTYMPLRCDAIAATVETRTRGLYDLPDDSLVAPAARANLQRLGPCLVPANHDVNIYMIAAANHRLLKNPQGAAAMYQRALALNRRPELYFQLGLMQLEMRNIGGSVQSFVRAVVFNRDLARELPGGAIQEQVIGILEQHYPHVLDPSKAPPTDPGPPLF